MVHVPGFKTSVKLSGTPTTLTSAAMSTYSTVAHTYQVTNTDYQCFSSTGTLTFTGNGTAINSSKISSINYLFGSVTFSTTVSTPIKATGKYIPLTKIAGAHQYTLTQAATMLDNTDFSSTGWTSRISGLKTVSLSLSKFEDNSTGTTESTIYDYFKSGSKFIVEIKPNTTGLKARGWFIVENENRTGGINDISDRSISFQLQPNLGYGKGFNWGS
jgi:hypothetical protein